MTLTRRSLLGLAAGLVVAGCRPRPRRQPAPPAADTAAVTAALAAEQALLADYERAIATSDAVAAGRLAPARDRHRVHLRALQSATARPSTAGTPTAPPGSPSLAATLQTSAASLQRAAISARAGSTAALLASIAAEHDSDAVTTSESP